MNRLQKIIEKVYNVEYKSGAKKLFEDYLDEIEHVIDSNHLLRANYYKNKIDDIFDNLDNLSVWTSDEDRMLHLKIQKAISNLSRQILDENKKIFIVHGRDISMRDKVSSLLGRLRLDYVILESEHNSGETVIEKFLRNAETCEYAIVLFSADDIGGLKENDSLMSPRVRQNVLLELGYFLGKIGRKNIIILHEVDKKIEKPSDYEGIVYEPFDEYGAWKSKLIKEMRRAKIYVEESLAERV